MQGDGLQREPQKRKNTSFRWAEGTQKKQRIRPLLCQVTQAKVTTEVLEAQQVDGPNHVNEAREDQRAMAVRWHVVRTVGTSERPFRIVNLEGITPIASKQGRDGVLTKLAQQQISASVCSQQKVLLQEFRMPLVFLSSLPSIQHET